MKQVTIIGLGIIGASLGLALRQLQPSLRITGNDADYDATQLAMKLKTVDKMERRLEDSVSGSDLVIVATPVGAIPEVLERLSPWLTPGTVVTDTGSTKRQIVRRAKEILPPNVSFVGGHPMTGKATAGVEGPDAGLFRDTIYCLTPSPSTPVEAVKTVVDMVQGIGATPYFADPSEHDGLVAGISHLPYLLSVALMKALGTQEGWREMSTLAAGGFENGTRAAAQDPRVFFDILASNADNVTRELDVLLANLHRARALLETSDPGLRAELEEAFRLRSEWESQRRKAHGL